MRHTLSVLFASTGLYPEKNGGRATYLHALTTALAARGIAVTIIAGRLSEAPLRCADGGPRIISYPVNSSNLLSEQASHLRGLSECLHELERHKVRFDAIVCDDPVLASPLLRARCFPEASRVYSFHSPIGAEIDLGLQSASSSGDALRDRLRPLLYRWYRRWVVGAERTGLHGSDLVVCLSEYMRAELLAAHPRVTTKIVVIPGGVDTCRFLPLADRSAKRRRLGIAGGDRLLVTARRLEPRMGLDTLISALPQVLASDPKVHLLIAGDGHQRESLGREIAGLGLTGRARLLGHLPAGELPRLYAAADLFVLPTRSLEGFGLATLEALACGTPVAATPVGGTPEWLSRLDPRMILADSSRDSIATGVLRMLDVCREEDRRLRDRCRSYAEQFRWSRIAEQFETELHELAETTAARRRGPHG